MYMKLRTDKNIFFSCQCLIVYVSPMAIGCTRQVDDQQAHDKPVREAVAANKKHKRLNQLLRRY